MNTCSIVTFIRSHLSYYTKQTHEDCEHWSQPLLLALSSVIMTCWLICKCKNHRTAWGSNLTHVAQNNGPEDLQYCILSASSTPGVLSLSNLQSFLTYLSELLENFLTIEDPALCSAASDDNNNDKVRRTSFSSSTDK